MLVKGSWEVKTSVLRTNRMKGGVRVYILAHSKDSNEGQCETLHHITVECNEGGVGPHIRLQYTTLKGV